MSVTVVAMVKLFLHTVHLQLSHHTNLPCACSCSMRAQNMKSHKISPLSTPRRHRKPWPSGRLGSTLVATGTFTALYGHRGNGSGGLYGYTRRAWLYAKTPPMHTAVPRAESHVTLLPK